MIRTTVYYTYLIYHNNYIIIYTAVCVQLSTIYLFIETTIQSAVPRARLHICRHGGWNRFSGQATHATPRSNLGEGISTLAVEKKNTSCFEKNTVRHITRSCFQSKPARDHRHSPIFHWIALSHPPTAGAQLATAGGKKCASRAEREVSNVWFHSDLFI